jgi:hypothetical protein
MSLKDIPKGVLRILSFTTNHGKSNDTRQLESLDVARQVLSPAEWIIAQHIFPRVTIKNIYGHKYLIETRFFAKMTYKSAEG